ncbi:MAG: hypothetical protein WD557_04210 [Dehalococcoidia bacterium]
MNTYTTLDGDVLDLKGLLDPHREFLDRAYRSYQVGMDWSEFANAYTNGAENPVLEPGRRVTRAVAETPLYRALRDLEDRVGIASGRLRPSPADAIERDPFDDALIPIAEAAKQKGVTVQAVHKAIERQSIVATRERPACVSQNSLDRWSVNETRRRAGKAAGEKSAAKK